VLSVVVIGNSYAVKSGVKQVVQSGVEVSSE